MNEIWQAVGLESKQVLVFFEVLAAMVLGGVIGYDRELLDKPAGFRTHMLVAGVAAFFVGLGHLVLLDFEQGMQAGVIRSDPIRIYEAIITGVSFLGAGTIIRGEAHQKVEGITTAASLLMTAAIGAAVGLGQWFLAVSITITVFLILHFFRIRKRVKEQAPEGPDP